MPLREIKVGMKGFGKTVIQGTDIETFQVDILGILANNKINENVLIAGQSILVKVRGEIIEKAGGIAAGMSGSPVYINDRLIGGLSSGWVMTDHTVGLVTPIEEMLEIWDYPLGALSGQRQPTEPTRTTRTARTAETAIPARPTRPATAAMAAAEPKLWLSDTPIDIAGNSVRKILEIPYWDTPPADTGTECAIFRQVAAPIVLQGLSGRAADMLRKRLQSRKFQVPATALPQPPKPGTTLPETGYTTGHSASYPDSQAIEQSGKQSAGKAPTGNPQFASPQTANLSTTSLNATDQSKENTLPGSAIGVQLARGDINVTTLGTLTHRSGKNILALAHPFLKMGRVAYLMTGANIHHSFSSVQMPFKIGAPTEMIGIITQDREKGIAGEVGRLPDMIPVQVDVSDRDLQRTKTINFQVVRDPTVLGTVVESTITQALESVIDREGKGTALMGIALDCANRSGEQYNFRRENMFFSNSDIVGTLQGEVTNLLNMVLNNNIEEVFPTRLALKVQVESRRRTLTIDKVEVKNTAITPGGSLDVWITLRPFREKSIVRKAKLPIPNDIGRENLTLTVFGLNSRLEDLDNPNEVKDGKSNKEQKHEDEAPDNFDAEIRTWVTAPKNSDLLFQLAVESDENKRIKLGDKDLEIQPTNLVVIGRVDTTIILSEE